MHPFGYVRADSSESAIATVAEDFEALFLAGGTSIVDLMKDSVQAPRLLVDINPLPLSTIEAKPFGVRIGAMARNSDVAENPMIRDRYPVLAEALLAGASPQLRNMATVGGNLMQRTRCYYFRDVAFACNKRLPGSGCPAIEGFNRTHAILGTSNSCIATHPSDMAVALVTLDAVVHTQGPNGSRRIPMADFHLSPGNTPEQESVLEHGELIAAVDLPASGFAARSHYLKVRDRASYEFALVSVAAALEVEAGIIRSARIALGGVATKPWRTYEAEDVLVGAPPDESTFAAAAAVAVRGAAPQRHNSYKVELTKRTLVRALSNVGAMP